MGKVKITSPAPACEKCGQAHVDAKGRPRCTGHTNGPTKEWPERPPAGPCRHYPIRGGTVCRNHGGGARQVRAKANKRLAAANLVEEYGAVMDPQRVMAEVGCVAFSDIGELYDPRGFLKPLLEWPEGIRRAVSSIKFVRRNVSAGDGHMDDVIEIKLWSKPQKLENAMKHHGQLKENVELSGNPELVKLLLEGRKRVADARNSKDRG